MPVSKGQILNPTGKGGFGDNPQNISGGRWSKETSVSYWYNYLIRLPLKEFDSFNCEYVAQELARNSIIEARKDLSYLKEVTDRTDGKPQQYIDHTAQIQVNKVERVIIDPEHESTD